MQITYDRQADVMYIRLKDSAAAGASPVNDLVNLYYTEDDQLAGIELFAFSQYADHLDDIMAQYDIRKTLPQE